MLHEEDQSTLRLCQIQRPSSGCCGFHLSRTAWDPYPWVSGVESGSPAELAGLQSGDCVLEVNGQDVLGQRILEVATRIRTKDRLVTLLVWNPGADPHVSANICGNEATPASLQRLSKCLLSALQLLECPVCLETIPPPAFQCCHGHVMCARCRSRSEKCPVCRVSLGPKGRCLLADKLHTLLTSMQNNSRPKSQLQKKSSTQHMQQPFHLKSRVSSILAPPEDITSSDELKQPRTPSISEEETKPQLSFHCPHASKSAGPCTAVSTGAEELLTHLRESHPGPVIQYYVKTSQSVVKLRLPLSSARSPPSSITSFLSDTDELFFVQVAVGATPGQRLVWLWLLGDGGQCDRYRLRLTLPEGDTHTGPVFPLTSTRSEVIDSNCCLSIEESRYNRANPEVRLEILDMTNN